MHQQGTTTTSTSTPPFITASPLLLNIVDPVVMTTEVATSGKAPALPSRQPRERSLTQDMRHASSDVHVDEDSQRCLLDFVEWWCHKLITAKSTAEVKTSEAEMYKATENFGTHTCDFGRTSNRIQLAGFSLDVALFTSPNPEQAQAGQSHLLQPEENWGLIREQLILLKSKLLRQDANADVVLLSDTQRQAQIKATPDFDREQSPLFQKQYKTVERLVQVQCALAVFQRKLSDLIQGKGSAEHKKLVREAIDQYEKQIHKLFSNELPKELAGFLLKDLYQRASPSDSPSNASSNSGASPVSTSTALAERLLSHVESILQGTGKYSQSTCQSALRKLLQDWHDAVLEHPTLVQLGYGGVGESAPSKKAIAAEDAMLRRLSNCDNPDVAHAIQEIDMEDISDIEDCQIVEPPKDTTLKERPGKKRKAQVSKFVPIRWVDSSTDEEEETEKQKYIPWSSKRSRRKEKASTSTKAKTESYRALLRKKKKTRNYSCLYTDSEEDPDNAPSPPPDHKNNRTPTTTTPTAKKRPRTTDSYGPTQHYYLSKSPVTAPPGGYPKITPGEDRAIREGARKLGRGRWKLVQSQAKGKLDKLSPQQIKLAYQQIHLQNVLREAKAEKAKERKAKAIAAKRRK